MSKPTVTVYRAIAAVLSLAAWSGAAQAQSTNMLPGSGVTQTVVSTALQSGTVLVNTASTSNAPALVVARSGSASTGRSMMVFATAYNSEAGQTDSSPFITATGTRTRPGVLAVSRDLLRVFPYGSRVRLEDTSGRSPWLSSRTFIVEDTMNARFTKRVDLWMGSRSEALNWGGRNIRISAAQ